MSSLNSLLRARELLMKIRTAAEDLKDASAELRDHYPTIANNPGLQFMNTTYNLQTQVFGYPFFNDIESLEMYLDSEIDKRQNTNAPYTWVS